MTILRLNIVIKCHLLHEFWSLDELILCKKCEQGNHVNIRRDKNPGPAECQWSVVPAARGPLGDGAHGPGVKVRCPAGPRDICRNTDWDPLYIHNSFAV